MSRKHRVNIVIFNRIHNAAGLGKRKEGGFTWVEVEVLHHTLGPKSQETSFILLSLLNRFMKLLLCPSMPSTSFFLACTFSILVKQLGGHA